MYLMPSSLSAEHEELLVDLVIEIAGHDAPLEVFSDLLLWLLEDISGFEGMSDARTRQVVNHFWSKYCGKKPH